MIKKVLVVNGVERTLIVDQEAHKLRMMACLPLACSRETPWYR